MKLAVIGTPVAHSLSPKIFERFFEHAKVEGTFERVDVSVNTLPAFLQTLRDDYAGASVTLPLKEEIIPLLDAVSESAALMGAVNQVVKRGAFLVGHNTDHAGVVRAISMRTAIKNKRVLILGASGAARAAAFGCCEQGASRVTIANRTHHRAEDVCQAMARVFDNVHLEALPLADADAAVSEHDIVINATSLGLLSKEDASGSALENARFHQGHTVLDMVYTPRKTDLLTRAEKGGAQICDGLLMLVFQAFEQAQNLGMQHLGRPAVMDAYAAITHDTAHEELLLGRARIDDIDAAVIALLGERFATAGRIGHCKKALSLDVVRPERERVLRETHRQKALQENVDPHFVQALFDHVLMRSKALQEKK